MSVNNRKKYRSIFISDVHLGTPHCQAEALAEFLKHNSCKQLYLVGDIIDGWQLQQKLYWPQAHSNVIRRVLTAAKRGTQVQYISGNHDEFLRKFQDYDIRLGNIQVCSETVHRTADGRRLLVTHGDLFDVITRYHRWVAFAGDRAYTTLMRVNRVVNRLRRSAGMPYWSLSAYAKHKVKAAVSFISEFENALIHECKRRELDGVICGHIHHAEIRDMDGVTYHNCGDWVESCTALAEHHDGRIELIRWAEATHAPAPTVLAAA